MMIKEVRTIFASPNFLDPMSSFTASTKQLTSSSAFAERPRDTLRPSVVSFNSVILRAQSFIIVISASHLPLQTIKCCSVVFGVTLGLLRRRLRATVKNKRRRLPSTVSSTCHGPAQLYVLHLAVEPFTTRDGA